MLRIEDWVTALPHNTLEGSCGILNQNPQVLSVHDFLQYLSCQWVVETFRVACLWHSHTWKILEQLQINTLEGSCRIFETKTVLLSSMWRILRSLCPRIRSGFWILATCQLYLFCIEVLVGPRWWVWCCMVHSEGLLTVLLLLSGLLLFSFMSQSLNGDHTLDPYSILHMWTDESLVEMYKYNSISISLSMYWENCNETAPIA